MEFRIADTFTASLGRLMPDEQRAAKVTAFELQLNPVSVSMSAHKLDGARDKNFWSVRVSSDLRIIIHKTAGSLLLCYVDHHDAAYAWVEKRRLETHPTTGAAQLVEIRETVQEIRLPSYVYPPAAPAPAKRLFERFADTELLSYGVPQEWLGDVRLATEDTLLTLADHLPGEAAEALLELAVGGRPRAPRPAAPMANPFDHPDAQRRFRIMPNMEELQRALDAPWEKWTIFLHPEQRQIVERSYAGPARVSGSAGTGKTIVALHRAVHVARSNPDAQVLLTTFSDILANALRDKLRLLVTEEREPQIFERIDVVALDTVAQRLYDKRFGSLRLAPERVIATLVQDATTAVGGHSFTPAFVLSEWAQVVDSGQIASWDAYRDVPRLGRKTRLPEAQRAVLWAILDRVRTEMATRGLVTSAAVYHRLAQSIADGAHSPYAFAIVDEAQDLTIPQLRFLAALGAQRVDALFFAGDLGQRIFQQPFSWKSIGVDVRGRAKSLRVNYRTSHQIRMQADKLLDPQVADVDGNAEQRNDTVSVFNGPQPAIQIAASEDAEIAAVGAWLVAQRGAGVKAEEIGVFVRSAAQIDRARAAVAAAQMEPVILDEQLAILPGRVVISTMHLAKGLEFKAVAVMACDDGVVPLAARIDAITDAADLPDVLETERHLLYVACTRARDRLLITATAPASEFLDDLRV